VLYRDQSTILSPLGTTIGSAKLDVWVTVRPGSHVSHFLARACCGDAGIRISLSSDIQRDGAGGIYGDHVNLRHRNEDGDKCVWGPVHTSVISSVEPVAVTHITVPQSFTCVREFASVWVQTSRETVPLRSRRDLRWPRELTSSQRGRSQVCMRSIHLGVSHPQIRYRCELDGGNDWRVNRA
jgi:hypothetical protein